MTSGGNRASEWGRGQGNRRAQRFGEADQTADEVLRVGVVLDGADDGAPQRGIRIDVGQGQDGDGNRSSAARGGWYRYHNSLRAATRSAALPAGRPRRFSVCGGPRRVTGWASYHLRGWYGLNDLSCANSRLDQEALP